MVKEGKDSCYYYPKWWNVAFNEYVCECVCVDMDVFTVNFAMVGFLTCPERVHLCNKVLIYFLSCHQS